MTATVSPLGLVKFSTSNKIPRGYHALCLAGAVIHLAPIDAPTPADLTCDQVIMHPDDYAGFIAWRKTQGLT